MSDTCKEDINPSSSEKEMQVTQAIFEMRNKTQSSLTHLVSEFDKRADLDYLFKITLALISTNEEIWERCEASLSKEISESYRKNNFWFMRYGFHTVDVRTKHNERQTLETRCEIQWKDFAFTRLPEELSNVLFPRIKEGNSFMNYREYLQNSLLLEETILIPFLAILKNHLEKIQVDLGKVETWIMANTQSTCFLRETFSVALEIKTQNVYHTRTCNDFCLRCQETFSEHKGIDKTADYISESKNVKESPAMCPDRVDEKGIFVQKSETILKRLTTYDAYNLSFDVTRSTGQKRLRKFLDFVEFKAEED